MMDLSDYPALKSLIDPSSAISPEPYSVYPNGKVWSFGRGYDKTGGKESTAFNSISSYMVDIVTSSFDQDISCLFVGNKGTGKSSTVLSICYHAAVKIAAWYNEKSNNADHKWQEFYNLEELTACILEKDANRLMGIQRPHVIKNYDDIGIGWGARNWRDEDNIQKNDIFQINRTDSAIQFFSIPNQFLLDKVPRSLVSHYVEMDGKFFELGYTTIKLFKPKTMFREGKIINPFLLVDRNKFVNYLIPKPPHDLWQAYKELRSKNKDTAIRDRAAQKKKMDELRALEEKVKIDKLVKKSTKSDDDDKETIVQKTARLESEYERHFESIIPIVMKMHLETGKPLERCLTKVCGQKGLNNAPLKYFRRENLLEHYMASVNEVAEKKSG